MIVPVKKKSLELPDSNSALPGRAEAIQAAADHIVSANRFVEPLPEHLEKAVFGLACCCGAERLFWEREGVFITTAGYVGHSRNPSYEDVCSGDTGHTEVVLVFFDTGKTYYLNLFAALWEFYDLTQGMRQGSDQGPQYRSVIYASRAKQAIAAKVSSEAF